MKRNRNCTGASMMLAFVALLPLQACLTTVAVAQEQRPIGVVPFDVTSMESGSVDASRALATLVRVELLKNPQLLPQLIKLPDGVGLPLASKQAAALGRDGEVEYVVVGTVLEATITRSSNHAATRRLGQVLGGAIGVSGSVTRITAKVMLHLQLVQTATGSVEAFEIAATNTDMGVGADLATTLGAFGAGDEGWQKTPMGAALREAAQKIGKEVVRRIAKPATPND